MNTQKWTERETEICMQLLHEICDIGLQGDIEFATTNCKVALICCSYAVKQGNPKAQLALGKCFLFGIPKVVAENALEASMWLHCSARQGCVDAKVLLSAMYIQGYEGIPKNARNAFVWCLDAALSGHVGAQYYVGVLYDCGYGCGTPNPGLALRWYISAINNGSVDALYNFGHCVRIGRGTTKDEDTAKHLFNLANELGEKQHRDRYLDYVKRLDVSEKEHSKITQAHEEQQQYHIQQEKALIEQVDSWFA